MRGSACSTRTWGPASRDAALRRSSARRLAGANALQANPAPEPAPAPRAAHGQLASPERPGELGAPQVDAVEGRGVDRDLEINVEPGVLQADRDLDGSSTIQQRLAGSRKSNWTTGDPVEAARDRRGGPSRRPRGRGPASGRGSVNGTRSLPTPDRLHDRLQVAAGERQAILQCPPLGPMRRSTISARSSARRRSVSTEREMPAGRAGAR